MAEKATPPDTEAPPASAAPVAVPAQSQGGDAPPVDTAQLSAQLTELTQTVQGLAEQSKQYRKGISTIGERVSVLVTQQQASTSPPQPQQQQTLPPDVDVFNDAFGRQPQEVTTEQMKGYIDKCVAEGTEKAKNEGAQMAYNAILADYGQAPLAANMAGRVNEFRDNSFQTRYPDAFVNAHRAEVEQKMLALGTVNEQATAFFYKEIEDRENAAAQVTAQETSQQQTQDANAPAETTNIQGATGTPPPPDGGEPSKPKTAREKSVDAWKDLMTPPTNEPPTA